MRGPSVCLSDPVHHAKVIGRHEMPFGRDTHMAPSNTVLNGGLGRVNLGVGTSTYSQSATMNSKHLY